MAIRYTYYTAATDLNPNKPGVNRITWEDNGSDDQAVWVEFTREYFPEDPRDKPSAALSALLASTPEEIAEIKRILGL